MWNALLEWSRDIVGSLQTWYDDYLRSPDWAALNHSQWPAMGTLLAVMLIAMAILLALGARGRRPDGEQQSLSSLTRWPRILGYGAVLLLVVGFGGWSSIAPLASAAIAAAVVSPDGNRKTIQHLEGGIIRAIHVREGDLVAVGQKLVTLEETQARAKYQELRERYVYLLATEARLAAEQAAAEAIEFPAELTTLGTGGAGSAKSQKDLFDSRRATRDGRERILVQRVKQLDEEIIGLREVIAAEDTQLELIQREIAGVKELYDRGLERLPRLLALQRSQADIRAEQASNRAQIAQNQQQIGETEMQLLTMRQEDKEKVNEELTKVRSDLAELRSQFPFREDILTRTIIEAPIAGTVMNVRVTTESGVVRPGDAILDIVPAEAALIIDARVKPIDIDTIHPGMKTRILLTAYRQRNLPLIYGSLRSISADRLLDDRSGEPYFLAKVEVDRAELARLNDVRLMPGMPVEVMILTGEQTMLDYFLREFLESITKSFRDS